jgi:glycosyltransferase involved in cell wall biosynthesis
MPYELRRKAEIFPVNGISSSDLVLLARQQEHDRDGSFTILSAGKLTRPKGFTLAVESFRIFIDMFPNSTLFIVGSGPDRSHLVSLTERLGLRSHVQFCDWLPRDDLLRRMKASDLFLFPSLRDGGGAVVVEALAAGKPVICLDIGGPGLHVTNDCGIKVTPQTRKQTITDLAAALCRLFSDEKMRRNMSEAAYLRAESLYRWDHLGERLREIYELVLRNGRLTEQDIECWGFKKEEQ